MSLELERQAVFQLVQSIMPSEAGPIAWPNVSFTVPSSSRWCAVELMNDMSMRMSLGRDYLKRTLSILQIDLFAPADTGTAGLRATADFLEHTLDMHEITLSDGDHITFRTPFSKEVALNEQRASNLEDNWKRRVVSAPFIRDSRVQK